jgi:dephospho-CoA kinase
MDCTQLERPLGGLVAKPYVIGLTGGIACGKSSVSAVLRQQGVPVIDADTLARELTVPKTPAYHAIRDYFGPACLNPDGTLNRAYLRTHIFTNTADKQWLEALLHPLIFQACLDALAALSPETVYAVLDIPLLIESKLKYPIDAIWVVDTTPKQQKARLHNRDDLSPSIIQAILAGQAPRALRLQKADVLIKNNKTLKELQAFVINLHEKTLRKCAQ